MKGCLRLLLRQGLNWKDITDRYAIIYGAGEGGLVLMSEYQLPNVKYVIDSDEKKWGTKLILLDKIYYIQSPELLSELSLDQYYIVISSERYAEEIKRTIEGHVDIKKVILCTNKKTLCFAYSSLKDLLFYDSKIKQALVRTNWSQKLDQLINLFISITKKIFPGVDIDSFISIRNGASKISFCFCVNDEYYIFSVPALYCETDPAMFCHDMEERKKKYQFRRKYNIGNELTVYEDNAGVTIQYLVNSFVDFDMEENTCSVLEKCYGLHQLDYDLDVRHDILRERYQIASMRLKRTAPWENEKIEDLNCQSNILFDEIMRISKKQKVCHGDVVCENIVSRDNELFLIDWEYMVMADPLYDVCNFLYSVGNRNVFIKSYSYVKVLEEVYAGLRQKLSFYYKRLCTDEELYRAYLIMQAIECRELMRDSLYDRHIEEERYEDLLKRLKKRKHNEVRRL